MIEIVDIQLISAVSGGENLMNMTGLNSSGAFTGFDNGAYFDTGSFHATTGDLSVLDSVVYGVKVVGTECFNGAAAAIGVSKVASMFFPEVPMAAAGVAGIGCGIGIGGGFLGRLWDQMYF